MSDVEDEGLTMEIVFSGISCAFKHFLLSVDLSIFLPHLDGLDEVDEVLLPCFPEC